MDVGKPLFQQIADQLADDILAGVYPEETQVPSTNELAAFLRVNPATAGKGLNLLVDQEILYKRRGLGMYVSTGAQEHLRATRIGGFTAKFIAPLVAEARFLGLDRDSLVSLVTKEME